MPTTHLEIVRANFGRRSDIQGELRQIDEAATTDNRAYSDSESARIEELRSELSAVDGRIEANLQSQIRELELTEGIQGLLGAIVDRESGEVHDTRTLGEAFTNSEDYEAFAAGGGQGRRYPSATIDRDFRSLVNLATGDLGGVVTPQRLGRWSQDLLDRRVFLADVLPHIPLGTGAAEIVTDETLASDLKAAEVAEGSAKPESEIKLDIVNEATPTIAHWANLTRQVAADAPQVAAYLDGRLRYGLRRRVDNQLAGGAGTSGTILGLANRPGINTVAPAAAEAAAISIRKAITEMEVDEAVPEIIVLHPRDAEVFDLTNFATAGLHAVPNLVSSGPTSSWGLTQVRSNAVAQGTALLIDPLAVAVLDRQDPTAYMTDSHASNFTSNILTLLLEMRIGLAVFQAQGICKVSFKHS